MSAPQTSPLADAYSRYARLITGQIEALERDDLLAVETLAGQRDHLAGAIDALRTTSQGTDASEDAVLCVVESCLQADVRLRRRLEQLQAQLHRSAGRIDRDRAAMRVYAAAASAGGTVDFSF